MKRSKNRHAFFAKTVRIKKTEDNLVMEQALAQFNALIQFNIIIAQNW